MKILLSGSSGLIGSALRPLLTSAGHSVIRLVRGPISTERDSVAWDSACRQIDLTGVGELDAAIHLAGETVAQRWTTESKRLIRDSRTTGTRLLCESMAALPSPPRIIVCASATGIYGNRNDEWLDESSSPGTGFLASVCREWEMAAHPALEQGIRVAHLRFGIVLTRHGGALAKMLPVFRLGLGGRIGDGAQFWSWVALDDVLGVIQHLLSKDVPSGPVNVVSPNPVTNEEFTRTLGHVLNRPTPFPIPRAMVALLLGEMGREGLLASFRIRPQRLLESGYRFLFPELEPALRGVLGKER